LLSVAQAADRPLYKNPRAPVDDRVADLLQRMTVEEKTSQLIQGDIRDYLNLETGALNETGLGWVMDKRSHAIWTGLYAEPTIIKKGAKIAQDYLTKETRLGRHSLDACYG
jgi:beta-glucosidase